MSCAIWFVWEYRATLPATLAAVEELAGDLRRRTTGTLGKPHSFAAELLAREVLNNAVLHGCRLDPERRIRCVLRVKRQTFTILVADGGRGFDWRSAWRRGPEHAATNGRGMQLLRRYATRVRFNEEGNSVTIVRRYCEDVSDDPMHT